uniref:Biotin carboxyl carrier protein of acetyl-CoA carboxylase n=1 Tax=Cyanidium sp. THAL103 TaxID=3027999 RepID=A0A9Y1I422_9RHOD|nr:acetyl-CoA carboxylase biotin carboxyl carrier protein [Cyanidium sp. THAL103]
MVKKSVIESSCKELFTLIENNSLKDLYFKNSTLKIFLNKRINNKILNNEKILEFESINNSIQESKQNFILNSEQCLVTANSKNFDIKIIYAPMAGTFYRASSHNAKPFIEIGDLIIENQVICIIEAMKLMNEIESECSGEIVEILPNNGDFLEKGQAIVKLKSS